LANRRWIYAGLALAAGYGMVRLIAPRRLHPGKTRLLLIGDSLAVGMAPPFRELATGNRIAFEAVGKTGTRIDQWADSVGLGETLGSFRPSLTLISLGTNDEYLTGSDAVSRQREKTRLLIARIKTAGSDYVWIGPPTLPKPTNGIVAMLRDEIPSSHYYPSDALTIPRGGDGIHPTARGYAGWAGAIWQWLS
jgi:hypothetical protein